MGKKEIVYLVDEDRHDRENLAPIFVSAGLQFEAYESLSQLSQGWKPDLPGCVLLNLDLAGSSGPQTLERWTSYRIDVPVIIIAAHAKFAMVVDAIKRGATDFLEKPADRQVLLQKVTAAISFDIARRERDLEHIAIRARLQRLTEREHQLIPLICHGLSNKEIARVLRISIRTVANHRAHLMRKVEAHNAADVVRFAIIGGEAGFDDPTLYRASTSAEPTARPLDRPEQ